MFLKVAMSSSLKLRTNAVSNLGASFILILAHGVPADALDEYLRMGESTILECTKQFAYGVLECKTK